jgi:hypothetical protein
MMGPAFVEPTGKLCVVLEIKKGANLKADILDTLSDTVRDGAKEALVGSKICVIARESMRFLASG